MDEFVNNKRAQLEKALTALEALGTRPSNPYHLNSKDWPAEFTKHRNLIGIHAPSGERIYQDSDARPDIQSEDRFNSIYSHCKAIEAAKAALRQELVYKLSPAETRVD